MLKRVMAPLIALAILGLATQPALADVGTAHWPRAEEPLAVYLADGLTPSWDVAIDHAISVWNKNLHVHYQRVGAGACDYAEPPNTIDNLSATRHRHVRGVRTDLHVRPPGQPRPSV